METKLYIGNLAFSTTDDELKGLFAEAGTVTSVEVIKDRFTGSSKGFAFIEMSNQAEAEKAINLFNGYGLGERAIKVSPAKPREESGSGGFGGPRRDGGNRGGQGGPGGGRNRTVVVAVNAGTKITINQSKSIRTETEKENVR